MASRGLFGRKNAVVKALSCMLLRALRAKDVVAIQMLSGL
jgi:hypothetical protein